MRTAGNTNGSMDINVKRLIDGGQQAGAVDRRDGPYLNGPGAFLSCSSRPASRPRHQDRDV
jgi:hypothetical protein